MTRRTAISAIQAKLFKQATDPSKIGIPSYEALGAREPHANDPLIDDITLEADTLENKKQMAYLVGKALVNDVDAPDHRWDMGTRLDEKNIAEMIAAGVEEIQVVEYTPHPDEAKADRAEHEMEQDQERARDSERKPGEEENEDVPYPWG